MSVDSPISIWEASAQEPETDQLFAGDAAVDVAIVGAGYTGLSTALHAAEAGLSAQVIEAQQIGYGGSGRNVGLVNAGLWLPPRQVAESLGPGHGPGFVELFNRGPSYVFSLIEKHQIRCEVTQTGTIHAAHAPSGLRDLQARHADWQRLGEPVELLSRAEMSGLTGTDVFHGGLLDRRAGTINPMGYCRGLARAAVAAGARIGTGARATALRRDGAHWIVETEKGVVRARYVVLGTNAYTDALWPDLKRVFTRINYFQLSTAPLGPEAAHILPGRQGLWDTGRIMSSLRRDAGGRLQIGSMGRVIGRADKGLSHRWARKRLARLFPALAEVMFEEAWQGQIAMTPDHLPRIHELAENLYTPIGYNGRGITTGTLFGRALADLISGKPGKKLPLPVTAPNPVKGGQVLSRVYDAAFTANQLIRSV
ncbi:FAD-binding oxidoreductase [Ruegeria sp. 2012CJ41-6]|uniref:FAD-binding oxidoreductase n=1 Tax=Ruegeria spongiae TaxID=2942209 RepID=A0ABT0Q507_9RHOB|nr:FAD-binding oxidoreductase [Ruegeria spongiae]MCL6284954.1 FAD-binding oxidoreductase [Ruegeria spongiae]